MAIQKEDIQSFNLPVGRQVECMSSVRDRNLKVFVISNEMK